MKIHEEVTAAVARVCDLTDELIELEVRMKAARKVVDDIQKEINAQRQRQKAARTNLVQKARQHGILKDESQCLLHQQYAVSVYVNGAVNVIPIAGRKP